MSSVDSTQLASHVSSQRPGRGRRQRSGVRRLSRYGLAASRFVGSRLFTLVAASFLIFAGLSAAPGNPVSEIVGAHASLAARAQVSRELGLDQPFLERYWHWLTGAIHGNFGTSIIYRSSVSSLLSGRITTTLELVAYSAVLIIVAGLALGIVGGAVRRLALPIAAVTGFFLGVPQFVASEVLVALLAVKFNIFPVQGEGVGFTDQLYHLTLPAIALAIGWVGYVAQITTAAVEEESRRDHVVTAIGRGISPARIFRRHVFRNAAIPMITVSGLTLAALFTGAIVVETAFNVPGIGSLLIQSVSSKDYNVVQAISLILVVAFIVATSLIDILQRLLDPRIGRREAGT
jgi:peptide/nickel transport system permease protein